MPLIRIPASEANDRIRAKGSGWPKTPEAQNGRLTPIAEPGFKPGFRIKATDLVFTIGSCFARNIENQMIAEGCNVAVTRFDIPPEFLDTKRIDRVLTRFVPFTMLNELRWALDPEHSFPEEGFVELKPGHWVDLHAGDGVAPSPLDRVKYRREAVRAYMAMAGQADVIVLTLGLAEAWFDTKTGHYMNLAPYRSSREEEPDRFELHLLDYNEITACLDDMHAVLSRFGRPGFRMLVTVSPIPLGATYSGEDIFTANTYSKAVQRAALEHFVRKHGNVDYFPSYESVTLSDRSRAWNADLAHASDEVIRINVLRMLAAYLENPSGLGAKAAVAADAFALADQAKAAVAAKDMEAAAALFHAAVQAAPDEALIRLEYGKLLIAMGRPQDAAAEISVSIELGAGRYGGYQLLARALTKAKRLPEAHAALVSAREHEGANPKVLSQSARVAELLGLHDEALEHIERYLASPDLSPAQCEEASVIHARLVQARNAGRPTAA